MHLSLQGLLDELSSDKTCRHIYQVLCRHGDAIAAEQLEKDGTVRTVTYKQYDLLTQRVASGLQAELGRDKRGAYVGLKVDNAPEWPALFWGILMAGYKPVLLDARAPAATTRTLLDTTAAVAIITREDAPYPIPLISPTALCENPLPTGFQPDWADHIGLCTSGTTSTARVYVYDGEALGHQILNAQDIIKACPGLMYEAGTSIPQKNLAFLPLHHIFGFIAVYLWYSFFGKTIVYPRDRAPETLLNACRAHQITNIYAVPLLWNKLAQGVLAKAEKQGKLPALKKLMRLSLFLQRHFGAAGRIFASKVLFAGVQRSLFGPQVRFLISGGGRVLPEALETINALGYPLYVGFGMTEAGITSVEQAEKLEYRLNGSVGIPFRSISYSVQPVGEDDQVGELCISGQSLHIGHLEQGELVRRDPQSAFPTGDIARLDKGRMWIEGRRKEIIINESGENIYPDAIEDVLTQLPGVEQLCVLGVPNSKGYEDITLVLSLSADERANAQLLPLLCETLEQRNASLPMDRKLRQIIIARDPLPLANGIKVQRQKLREALLEKRSGFDPLNLATGRIERTAASAASKPALVSQDPKYLALCAEVRKLFQRVLDTQEDIDDTAHFIFDLGGDSLSAVAVLTQIEDLYAVSIDDTDYMQCVCVQDVAVLLYTRLYGTAPVLSARITPFPETVPGSRRSQLQ